MSLNFMFVDVVFVPVIAIGMLLRLHTNICMGTWVTMFGLSTCTV